MAAGRFDWKMPLPPQGRVPIKGPFDPQDPEVHAARVLFLIVQGEGENTVIVDGDEGTWHRPSKKWSGTAPRTGRRVGGGTGALKKAPARGIALAIVIKPEKVLKGPLRVEPPAIETLMWCATFNFV